MVCRVLCCRSLNHDFVDRQCGFCGILLDVSRLSHLQALEAESIQIIREVVSEFQRPVMLYSIGKDSSVMMRLAQKAFYPGPIPFPLLHVDTTYKFKNHFASTTAIEFLDNST